MIIGHPVDTPSFKKNIILKSSTGIDEIAYRYCQNHLPVLAKSSTGFDEILYQGNKLAFSQNRYMILSIPVGDFAKTGRQFHQ